MSRLLSRAVHASLAFVALGALLPTALAAQTTYVAFGDSVTAGTGDGDGPLTAESGYPSRLETLLDNATVINRGRESGTSLDLLEEELSSVLALGGDVLLLMVGTNDVTNFANGSSNSNLLADFTFNLQQIRRRAANRGMSTIHSTVIPRWPEARRDPENFVTKRFNQDVRHMAGTNGLDLVDPYERFLEEPRRFGLFYAPIAGDAVGHPSPTGYDAMAETFADVINGVDSRAPALGLVTPDDGDKRVDRRERILIDIWDFGTGVNASSIELTVNGEAIAVNPIPDGQRFVVNYAPPERFLGKVEVALRASDRSTPPLTFDRTVATYFTTQTNFPDGDVNRDGRVDGVDLSMLAAGFGKGPDAAAFDPDADFDQDGDIDGTDLAVLVDNFGTSL